MGLECERSGVGMEWAVEYELDRSGVGMKWEWDCVGLWWEWYHINITNILPCHTFINELTEYNDNR